LEAGGRTRKKGDKGVEVRLMHALKSNKETHLKDFRKDKKWEDY
jgi:hypothetical protein